MSSKPLSLSVEPLSLSVEPLSLSVKPLSLYRSYSLNSREDEDNINNGRCPDYALNWGDFNNPHWSKGHDYYIGNSLNMKKEKEELRKKLSERLNKM